jgi:hypothetical protein
MKVPDGRAGPAPTGKLAIPISESSQNSIWRSLISSESADYY